MQIKIEAIIKARLAGVKDALLRDLLDLHKQVTTSSAISSVQQAWSCGCYYDPEADVTCLMHLILELHDIECEMPN